MKLIANAAEMRAIPRSTEFRNGGVSFWYRDAGLPERRAPLPGDADYDVCVVGAGYTGLWTAYYLKKARPDLRVAVLEREFAGFGASGRNGGWLSAEFAGSRERYAESHGKGAVIALQRAMMAAVDEVIEVAEAESIDADIVKGGMRTVATNPAQKARLLEEITYLQEWGYWPEDFYLLEPDHEPRLRVDGTIAEAFSPHAARVQPAKLARGLAAAVAALGVDVFEDTAVTEIRGRQGGESAAAVTERGTVRAAHVIRATEGFTASMAGERRQWLPMHSSMIATEPLSAEAWKRIGWEGREVLGDAAHAYVYAQRTADDRIAIGGRGAPYRFGSGHDNNGATQPQAIAELWRALVRLFPAASEVPVAHAWSGVLGVSRDWCPTVHLDSAEGLGWAGGYVGSGVTASNLAGRTLRDLVLGRTTELTRLPWVGHRARGWEPEPLRWIGTQVSHGLYRTADRREADHGAETSTFADLAARISGR
ncbi:NAD(P)/FAD-dependent oxidoreductase [Actinorugispora endophytica]|uniref:Glycine/D-amino acid oxidase-like deaminating enzyme n=1 Tax=Actinorugispora endophytica TaxID=1605990 RepID=A0A4R6UHA0_9ACTN|nr:FAD-binding oxidoreductase [Actinorugispora endophytica]TDQ45406.1 glycine/D-amino acid oxidase-like deaminating enzyme [Actinorugispora endophytica]